MKTKKLFLAIATIVFSSYGFSQELSENALDNILLTQSDNLIQKAEMPELVSKRATFNKSTEYKSLQEFISSNIEFPDDARLIGTSGEVIVHFEIQKDGSPGEIYFIKSPDPLFSDEVERVLRLAPNFNPAFKDGRIVSSYEQIKIEFKLN